MPLFRAELDLAREETDANGNLLLTRQETRRARAELKQVKSAPTLAAAQAALAGFRQALEQARSNEFKDASVAQKTDATAHTVQIDALRHEIAQLNARLNFFASSGKPLAGQPMTAAEIASARGHIEAAQTLYRKYQESTPGELTGEEVGLVRAALLGSGTVAALMGQLKSASVGADALVNLPASAPPALVRAVWRADLEARVGETVTVGGEVRQRFTKLEAQQLREQLSAVWNAAKSGGDVASLYSAYAQAVGNLSANTATEVRYESGLTAYTDAESRRIRDAGREFKRIAEARGTSHADAIAAHQRYVDTVTEARANGFVRETVTQLDGAVAPADALALLRARIAQMQANLDYFGNHSAPADRLTASDVSQARGLLDRAEFLLKAYSDAQTRQVTAAELQAVVSVIGTAPLTALSAKAVNAPNVPADRGAVKSAANAWVTLLKLKGLTDQGGDGARKLTDLEVGQLEQSLADVARACRSTAGNRGALIEQAWTAFETKQNQLLSNGFTQGAATRIPGPAASDRSISEAEALISRMQARLTYFETVETQAFTAADLSLARAVVEQASWLLRSYSLGADDQPVSQSEVSKVLAALGDTSNAHGASQLMTRIDNFDLAPRNRTLSAGQLREVAKVWRSELDVVVNGNSKFTSWEVQQLETRLGRIRIGNGGQSLGERWSAYQSVISSFESNDFLMPAETQLSEGASLRPDQIDKLSAMATALQARAELLGRVGRITPELAAVAGASVSVAQELLRTYQEDDEFTTAEADEVQAYLQGSKGTHSGLQQAMTNIRNAVVNPLDGDIRREDRLYASRVWLADLRHESLETILQGGVEVRKFTPGEARRLEDLLRVYNKEYSGAGPGSADAAGAWAAYQAALATARTQLAVPAVVLQHGNGTPVGPQQIDTLKARLAMLQARLDDHRAHSTGVSPAQILQAQESIDKAEYFLTAYSSGGVRSSEFNQVVNGLNASLPAFMNTSRT